MICYLKLLKTDEATALCPVHREFYRFLFELQKILSDWILLLIKIKCIYIYLDLYIYIYMYTHVYIHKKRKNRKLKNRKSIQFVSYF